MAPGKKTCATNSKTTPSFTPACEAVTCEAACAAAGETVATPVVATPVVASETATSLVTSGRVKWFNNKAGYGFITVNDCETNEERDMFVHHSEIKVDQTQYKYLVQGEYVEFVIGAINRENKIDAHATNVRGINGGKLMCETRNEVRSFRSSHEQTEQRPARPARQESARPAARQESTRPESARPAARRPQLTEADQTEWMVVPRRRVETAPSRPARSQPRQRQPEIEMS
jgi:cold shock CspA family protein